MGSRSRSARPRRDEAALGMPRAGHKGTAGPLNYTRFLFKLKFGPIFIQIMSLLRYERETVCSWGWGERAQEEKPCVVWSEERVKSWGEL